jgi:hypothetical protein
LFWLPLSARVREPVSSPSIDLIYYIRKIAQQRRETDDRSNREQDNRRRRRRW